MAWLLPHAREEPAPAVEGEVVEEEVVLQVKRLQDPEEEVEEEEEEEPWARPALNPSGAEP